MNLPPRWFALLGLAGALAGVALWAGSNLPIALPAATVAVLVGSTLLVSGWAQRARSPRGPVSSKEEPPVSGTVRSAFRSNRMSREEVVLLLDRIERSGPNPSLPNRATEELRQIGALPRPEFARYVEQRLVELEGNT
ncbi:MAG TPA: hypothetical protein VEE86_03415 [Thermoplasmata archaeon]|nr:hypothetical protein [Thermoplasmata archaeon]